MVMTGKIIQWFTAWSIKIEYNKIEQNKLLASRLSSNKDRLKAIWRLLAFDFTTNAT